MSKVFLKNCGPDPVEVASPNGSQSSLGVDACGEFDAPILVASPELMPELLAFARGGTPPVAAVATPVPDDDLEEVKAYVAAALAAGVVVEAKFQQPSPLGLDADNRIAALVLAGDAIAAAQESSQSAVVSTSYPVAPVNGDTAIKISTTV